MGVSSGSGTVYHSNVHEFTSGFLWGLCVVLLVFCVMFTRQWFVLLCFFCHCIIYSLIYGFWLLVLLSSNSACRGLLEWTFTQKKLILYLWLTLYTIQWKCCELLSFYDQSDWPKNCITVFIIALYIHVTHKPRHISKGGKREIGY
jgi:hypothetical protein